MESHDTEKRTWTVFHTKTDSRFHVRLPAPDTSEIIWRKRLIGMPQLKAVMRR